MSFFWTNTIWYVLLGVLTLTELVFVLVRATNRRQVIAFYLTALGILLNFESVVLIFLKAYDYFPMIIRNAPFDDSLAGNLFSQLSISATALLAIIFNLPYYWFFILAGIYGIIEEVFLALGIYSHNWYRTWMTVVLFPLFFWTAKKMYTLSLRGMNPQYYYLYILLGLFPLNISIIDWGFILTGLQTFNPTVLSDPDSSRSLLVLVHFFLLSIPVMLIYFLRLQWKWKALVILVLYALNYTGYRLNLILIKNGWFLVCSTVSIFWMYLSVFILDRLYDPAECGDVEQ